jgi:hypothetical protein
MSVTDDNSSPEVSEQVILPTTTSQFQKSPIRPFLERHFIRERFDLQGSRIGQHQAGLWAQLQLHTRLLEEEEE